MKVLSFDVESNGLHGDAFAVAGIVIDDARQVVSEFVARCPIVGSVDPWVTENVLEPMSQIPESAKDGRELRDKFWKWYTEAKSDCDLIVAANPYPVEARFLMQCQADDHTARDFEHPFPYFDLSSMLYSLGITTSPGRREFVAEATAPDAGESHNPIWDAKATALAALKIATQVSHSSANSHVHPSKST